MNTLYTIVDITTTTTTTTTTNETASNSPFCSSINDSLLRQHFLQNMWKALFDTYQNMGTFIQRGHYGNSSDPLRDCLALKDLSLKFLNEVNSLQMFYQQQQQHQHQPQYFPYAQQQGTVPNHHIAASTPHNNITSTPFPPSFSSGTLSTPPFPIPIVGNSGALLSVYQLCNTTSETTTQVSTTTTSTNSPHSSPTLHHHHSNNNIAIATPSSPSTTSPKRPGSPSSSPVKDARLPIPKPIKRYKYSQLDPDGRKCSWCNTTNTPEWRTGPANASLCNACGLKYRASVKEMRSVQLPTTATIKQESRSQTSSLNSEEESPFQTDSSPEPNQQPISPTATASSLVPVKEERSSSISLAKSSINNLLN